MEITNVQEKEYECMLCVIREYLERTPARIYVCQPSVGTNDIMDEYMYIERQYQGELHKYLSKGLKLSWVTMHIAPMVSVSLHMHLVHNHLY